MNSLIYLEVKNEQKQNSRKNPEGTPFGLWNIKASSE